MRGGWHSSPRTFWSVFLHLPVPGESPSKGLTPHSKQSQAASKGQASSCPCCFPQTWTLILLYLVLCREAEPSGLSTSATGDKAARTQPSAPGVKLESSAPLLQQPAAWVKAGPCMKPQAAPLCQVQGKQLLLL